MVDGLKCSKTGAAIKKVLLEASALKGERYKVGSTGQLVKWVQERINVLLGCNLVADGMFDRHASCGWSVAESQKSNSGLKSRS